MPAFFDISELGTERFLPLNLKVVFRGWIIVKLREVDRENYYFGVSLRGKREFTQHTHTRDPL